MVVCKCRKATKLYCFVHKVPVCGDCIYFPEHQKCVVHTYSEWVVDGDYDWPPKCCLCLVELKDGNDSQLTRLGCLHLIHTSCLVSHIRSLPPHTAPAGYVCPTCSAPVWPPKSIKDSGSHLHLKLKDAIMQTGLEKNFFGSYPVSMSTAESRDPPPAFASDSLTQASGTAGRGTNYADSLDRLRDPSSSSAGKEDKYMTKGSLPTTVRSSSKLSTADIVEMDDPSPIGNQFQPGATTRKGVVHVEWQNSETSYFADDEDGKQKKYSRRGPLRHKFLRALLPFWSSALPTLPVTAPSRKDASNMDDRHQRSSRLDPRRILLFMAIMACMATMAILYYRLSQRILGENRTDDNQQ